MKQFHIIPLAIVVTCGMLSQEISCSMNFALKKPTRQSSLFTSSRGSFLAVDGNTNSNFSSGTCIHTRKEPGWHWWYVEFNFNIIVRYVRITNRADCCGSNLRDFSVEVSRGPPSQLPGFPRRTNAAVCVTVKDQVPTSGPITYECDQPVTGRYVRIVKESPRNSPLMLCEFEVYGSSLHPPNLALGRPATQSSTLNSVTIANKSVDGDDDNNLQMGSCSHTKYIDAWHWWQVDLQDNYHISSIVITNRGDCCSYRLQGISIEISEEEPSTLPGFPKTTNSPLCLTHTYQVPTGLSRFAANCPQPTKGRYVRFVKESRRSMPLALCEVEIHGIATEPFNIAYGKPATQSSMPHPKFDANNALDGNFRSNLESGSCSHTKETDAWHWWQVDLQDNYIISAVLIANRNDCCSEKLQRFTIEVSKENPSTLPGFPKTTNAAVCLKRKEEIPNSSPVMLECDQPVKGRYLRIVKNNDKGALTLCEVEVYERSTIPNIAYGKPATESSTQFSFWSANNAVDGNLNGFIGWRSCTHTNGHDSWHWWQVDLQEIYTISSVRIANRIDCCSDRLQRFTIEVSKENPSTLPGFPKTTNAAVCLERKEEIPSSSPAMLECDQPVKGRYLRIVKSNDEGPLSLCEVEVYEWQKTTKAPVERRVNGKNGLWRFIHVANQGSKNLLTSLELIRLLIDCARKRIGDRTDLYTDPYIQVHLQTKICRFFDYLPDRSDQIGDNWIIYKLE